MWKRPVPIWLAALIIVSVILIIVVIFSRFWHLPPKEKMGPGPEAYLPPPPEMMPLISPEGEKGNRSRRP